MLVMGLDTSLQRCSIAIIRGGETVGTKIADMDRGHAEHVAPMAYELLRECGFRIADLDRIAVVCGPGGFTGVRIGLSFARGFAIGTGVSVVGVSSLAALAEGAAGQAQGHLIAPVIDARRGQIYAGLFSESGEILLKPFVAEPKQAMKKLANAALDQHVLVVGSGGPLIQPMPEQWRFSGAFNQIDPAVVARLGARLDPASAPANPLYLRAPDAKPPKPSIVA